MQNKYFGRVKKYQQQGFTLVEIAVVLVIIGVLLGGVLQGAQLIENAKVKKLVAEINGYTSAYYAYQDKYGRQPGDDGNLATIQARGGDWASAPRAGNLDGTVASPASGTFNNSSENFAFFQHLRAAGFIPGDVTADIWETVFPVNASGGSTGTTNESVMGGLNGLKLCMSKVPGSSAIAVDNQLDDGEPDSGRFRATTAVAGANTVPGAAATAYDETAVYTTCVIL